MLNGTFFLCRCGWEWRTECGGIYGLPRRGPDQVDPGRGCGDFYLLQHSLVLHPVSCPVPNPLNRCLRTPCLQDLMKKTDSNADGSISYDEFRPVFHAVMLDSLRNASKEKKVRVDVQGGNLHCCCSRSVVTIQEAAKRLREGKAVSAVGLHTCPHTQHTLDTMFPFTKSAHCALAVGVDGRSGAFCWSSEGAEEGERQARSPFTTKYC